MGSIIRKYCYLKRLRNCIITFKKLLKITVRFQAAELFSIQLGISRKTIDTYLIGNTVKHGQEDIPSKCVVVLASSALHKKHKNIPIPVGILRTATIEYPHAGTF